MRNSLATALGISAIMLAGCGNQPDPATPTNPIVPTEALPTETPALTTLIMPTALPEDATPTVSNEMVSVVEAQQMVDFRVPGLTIPGFEQDGRASVWTFDFTSASGEHTGTFHTVLLEWLRQDQMGAVSSIRLEVNERATLAYLFEPGSDIPNSVGSLGELPAVMVEDVWDYQGQEYGEPRTRSFIWIEDGLQYRLTVPKNAASADEVLRMLLPEQEQ